MAFGNPHARVSCWETHLQMAFSAWGGHRRVESWEDWGAAAVEIREQLTHLTNQMSFKHIVSAVWDPLPLYRKKVDLQHQTNLENLKMVKSVS